MKIGILIEAVYTSINGGKPTTDDSVLRVDIRALLPAAVNYAMDKAYNHNLQTEGSRDMPSEFYGTYENIPIDRSRPIPTITLQKGIVSLKGNAGIRFVYNDRGEQLSPLSDADMGSIRYYLDKAECMKWFKRRGNVLDLYGVGDEDETLTYQAITSVDDLSDDDEAPIQAGLEPDVISLLAGWVSGTKQFPHSNVIDTKDPVNSAN